jgi:branched-chain amino acid transport system permease protein
MCCRGGARRLLRIRPARRRLILQALTLGLVDGVLAAGVYALMAIGLSLVFGVMGIVNIGQSAFVVLGGYASYILLVYGGIDPLAGLAVILPAFFVLGVLVERLFLRRLEGDRALLSLLATFAIATVIEGVLGVLFTGSFIKINARYVVETYKVGSIYIPLIYVYAFALSVALLVGLYLLLYHTTFGRSTRATMQDRFGAQVIGIRIGRVSAVAFGLGTALAAAGGTIYTATSAVNPASWYDLIPVLFAIVILGGLGSLRGVLISSLVVLVSTDVAAVTLSPVWSPLVAYGIILAVLAIRPQGLFGQPEGRAA